MLESLRIKNFAIIENTEIDFKKGLTVLTGETGAGKTIIIDAIGLLLGDRASNDMIRHGESKAIIEGVFSITNQKVRDQLRNLFIEVDDKLIIVRQLLSSGKSTLRVNDETITLASLRKISRYLLDIHLQHDAYRLIDPTNYIELLDDFTKLNLTNYKKYYTEYNKAVSEYKKILNYSSNINSEIDFLTFQKEELEEANLNVEEEIELLDKQQRLENFDKIHQNIKDAFQFLDGKTLSNLYSAKGEIEKLTQYSEHYENLAKTIESSYYDVEDVLGELKSELQGLDFNPNELSRIQSRLQELNKLKRKYNLTIEGLIQKLDDLNKKIQAHEDKDYLVKEAMKTVSLTHENLVKEAQIITSLRKSSAISLQEGLTLQLTELHLPNAKFAISFNEVDMTDNLKSSVFFPNGVDEIDFLISTNKGEPVKSLSKTASGGEISRVMLALKTILLKSQNLSSVIFDEIDSGVSGKVAHGIAKKVKLISEDTQVLLITHLPQVAAIADNHLFVSKHVVNDRTVSHSTYLDINGRVEEVAKMLSNEAVTPSALINAKDIIDEYR